MTTVASPVSIREQALAIIAARLGAPVSSKTEMAGIGGAVVGDILIDLERAFDIGLDPDEVLFPGATVHELLELTCRRAQGGARVFHWDDERLRRALPYFAGRPQLAYAADVPAPTACAPPPWPEVLETPPQTRTACAVPSEEVWAAVLASIAREERGRRRILIVACVVIPFALGFGGYWLHSLGLG